MRVRRPWRVVAGAGTAALFVGLGSTGALAASDGIGWTDRTEPSQVEDVQLERVSDSLDSAGSADSPDSVHSVDSPDSAASIDSPEPVAPVGSADSAGSVDSSDSVDSVDSADSVDSPDSADSVD